MLIIHHDVKLHKQGMAVISEFKLLMLRVGWTL